MFFASRSSHAQYGELAREGSERQDRDGASERRRQESTTSVAAGCTCITCRTLLSRWNRLYDDPRSSAKKKEKKNLSAVESGMEHRANECAARCSVKFSNLQILRILLDSLE